LLKTYPLETELVRQTTCKGSVCGLHLNPLGVGACQPVHEDRYPAEACPQITEGVLARHGHMIDEIQDHAGRRILQVHIVGMRDLRLSLKAVQTQDHLQQLIQRLELQMKSTRRLPVRGVTIQFGAQCGRIPTAALQMSPKSGGIAPVSLLKPRAQRSRASPGTPGTRSNVP